MILSVDIETFGAVKRFSDGRISPRQHTFHPMRALNDGVPLKDQIVTVSVTICSSRLPFPQPGFSWKDFVAGLEPGHTMVFRMDNAIHRKWLAAWLSRATLILGMNLPFDILWLRYQPDFRPYLIPSRLLLLDLSVLNYLHSEIRPERSLKSIVSILNLDRYSDEDSLKHGHRYSNPRDPKLALYNARDSHNTALGAGELGHRISQDHPSSDKLSDWCVRHYSATIFLCCHLSEHGVPFSRELLQELEQSCLERAEHSRQRVLATHGIPFDGPGSQRPQLDFMQVVARTIDSLRPTQPSILSDKRLLFSDKKKQLGPKDINREIFAMALPLDHPLQSVLDDWDTFKTSQKLVSSYTYPLLRGSRKPKPNKYNTASILVRNRAYPTWYPVPSQTKDGEGDSGGTDQGRYTAKNPAVQTLPASVKDCIRPSHPEGSILWIDLSQIELRVAALLSNERTLIDDFIAGNDLHTARAISVFGRDELLRKYPSLSGQDPNKWHKLVPSFADLERQCGKHGNFTDLNLGGAAMLQRTILKKGGVAVPLSFCEAIVNARPTARPNLWRWQQETIARARRDKIIYLPLCGLSRYFSGHDNVIDETYRSTIVNFPVQTWAGLLMREFQIAIMSLYPFNHPDPPARQFINIYDATALDCKPGVIPIILPLIQQRFDALSQPGGLWHTLQSIYSVECPIRFDTKEVTH